MKFDVTARIDMHVHNHGDGPGLEGVLHKLNELFVQGKKIMATQAELATKLDGVTVQLVKIGGESSKTMALVEELKAIIANGPPVTPELQAAFDKLAAQAQVVDDLTPDEPTP